LYKNQVINNKTAKAIYTIQFICLLFAPSFLIAGFVASGFLLVVFTFCFIIVRVVCLLVLPIVFFGETAVLLPK
jgi:hypothetical protein